MKKDDEKLIINSLDEFQELIIKCKTKKIKLFIEKEMFIGESKEFYDKEIYNEFEYVVEFEERFFFAFSREMIEEILKKCLEEKIELEGIYLKDDTCPKILDKNFLKEEYKQEKRGFILQKKEIFYILGLSIVLLMVTIYFEFAKVKIQNKTQLVREELNFNYEKIKELEDFVTKNSLEKSIEKEESKKNYFNDIKKVDIILNDIEKALEEMSIEKIEINGEKIKITGSAYEIQEIYKFEKNLYGNFKDINNDFIKKDKNIYKFIFDFTIKE